MINWQDPDYVAQGHFATIIKSITIQCSAETAQTVANNGSLPANAQSYVYTTNDTTSHRMPQVLVTNESTNVNAAVRALPGGFGAAAGFVSVVAGVLSLCALAI